MLRLGRDRDARRLPRPGPAPLRPLLRPDAGPVLLPLRRLGQRTTRASPVPATMKMIVYTLIGSLLMLVGGDRHRRSSPPTAGELTLLDRRRCSENLLGEGSQHWIFWFFAAAFLVKMPAFLSTAGCRTPTGRRRCRCWSSSPACSPRSAPTASCASSLPLFPDAPSQFQEVVLVIALASILYGSVMAFTQTNVRLIAGYSLGRPARLHHPRDLRPAPRRRRRRGPADGQPRPRRRAALPDRRAALAARRHRGPARDGRPGDAGAGPGGALPDRHPGDAGDAGSANFVGEFYILNGVFQDEDRLRLRRDRSGSRWPPSTRCASTSGRCTTACPRASTRARSSLRDGVVLVPLVACIVALALYPGLILKRGEASVEAARQRQ